MTIAPELFQSIRNLPKVSAATLATQMRVTVKPAVQKEVIDLVATYPGPVKYPFAFATAKSRRAYFATGGFGHGIPYRRTLALMQAWKTTYNFAERGGFIAITNEADAAQYVYGFGKQQQVPGHRNTGWGKDMPTALELIDEYMNTLVIDAWYAAVKQAAGEI